MRCVKAKRACGGYEELASSTFRHYVSQGAEQSSTFVSTARKCSLPIRTAIPGTNILPEDTIPAEVTHAQSNALAQRAFFYDYCIDSANANLSQGFLSGLEVMARRLQPKSALTKACQAVSFASHGKPLRRPQLIQKAALFYQELLGALADTIDNPAVVNSREPRLIAMLLGLYQIITSDESDYGNHQTHARGLAALMGMEHSPLGLFGIFQKQDLTVGNVCRVFSVPAMDAKGESLDTLLHELDALRKIHEESFGLKNINALRNESIDLDMRLCKWAESRDAEFKPTTIGCATKGQHGSGKAVGYWPGKVDTYFDSYVAGVWNIYRAARLTLIALTITFPDNKEGSENYPDYIHTAYHIAEDMLGSIPYHLADNLQVFLAEMATNTDIMDPGKSLGGLLLMHPLYIASTMPFLPVQMREYMRACLTWIGSYMGLGQATLLANTPEIDRDYLESGCMIIWSGFVC
ncbi:hypothetical protein BJ170DRAFT_641192 [Xylariales sp. AK1849]|nr:hypothetical protein BJ170DRAFT_641192 [Xylariales sp. AK1849]